MKIDYISDLHLDFHVRHDGNYEKWERKTHAFLEELLPEQLGEVLVIAGDLSHYNVQSQWILSYYSKLYKKVLYVCGNHDYYLISHGQNKKYKNNSKNREMELVGMTSHLINVTQLFDFNVYEYEGIKFAGATNWYPLTEFKDKQFFNSVSNDSRLIKGLDIGQQNYIQTELYNNMEDVDVIVTHVPPIIINSHHKYGSTSCYLNELKQIKAKHVVMAHCHEQNIYEKGTCKFYVNSLGYPSEFTNWMNPMDYERDKRIAFWNEWKKIKSFEVVK